MKHTRSILNQINSQPAFESMDVNDIPMVDASEGSFLALESMDIMNEVGGCFDESAELANKEGNLSTLVDYVEGEVNGQGEDGALRTATQNEVALVEQAVTANTDGTGLTEDEVLPALESAEGSQIALEGVKDAIASFGKAAVELVKKIGAGFSNFMKVIFTRLGALRSEIAKTEKAISKGKLKTEPFDVNRSLSRYALLNGNDTVKNSKELATAAASLFGSVREIGTEYPKQIIDQYDGIIKAIDIFFRKGEGRTDAKRDVRKEVTTLITEQLKKTVALNSKTFKDSKLLGGFVINYEQPTLSEKDLNASVKSMWENSPVIGTAGNANERETTFKFDNEADAKAIVNTIKSSLGFLGKVSSTNSMGNIAFFTQHFTLSEIFVDVVINGFETVGYKMVLNDLNRIYMGLYTRPAMAIIEHFMRVAQAQLTLIQKSYE